MVNCFAKELISKFKNDINIIKIKSEPIEINSSNIINIMNKMVDSLDKVILYNRKNICFYVSYKIAYYYREFLQKFNGDLEFMGYDVLIYDDIPDNEMFLTFKENIFTSNKKYRCVDDDFNIIIINGVDYVKSEYIVYYSEH